MKVSLPVKLAALFFFGVAAPAWAVNRYADDVPPPAPGAMGDAPAAMAVETDPASAGVDCYSPSWCFEVGAVILDRSANTDTTLLTDALGDKICSTGQFDIGYEVGPVFALTHAIDCCKTLELRYFFIDQWNDALNIEDTGTDYNSPWSGGTYRELHATFSTDLHSFEANVWHNHCGFDVLYGFRYIDLSEKTTAEGSGLITDGRVSIEAQNRLFGFQTGARKTIHSGCNLCFSGFGKAGVFYNDSEATAVSEGDYGDVEYTKSEGNVSWVTEAGIRADYCVACNLRVFATYEVLWLGVVGEGVATACKQYDKVFAVTPTLDDSDDVFFHGALVGVEWCH